ncbi:MAG TPA: shikimate dehydrogenase [Bacteroidota bacterium]|nr:shikimate dehydrogenase [Bacteroidota bacterium]
MEDRYLGIIGRPLGHSLSPAMHSAAIKQLGLHYKFGALEVADNFLPALISSMKKNAFAGFNVTIPHKRHIIPLLDEVSDAATAVGAVNTIVNKRGLLKGYNTDIDGLQKTLEPVAKKIKGTAALILGAGGASRAALYAVAAYASPRIIRVYNRTPERGKQVVDEFGKLFPHAVFELVPFGRSLQTAVTDSTLIINTTSVGMTPDTELSPLPKEIRFSNQQIIVDIIYTPLETALLRHARMDGAQTINGVEMFIQQGAKAFELWTGKTFPVELGRRVVMEALSTR